MNTKLATNAEARTLSLDPPCQTQAVSVGLRGYRWTVAGLGLAFTIWLACVLGWLAFAFSSTTIMVGIVVSGILMNLMLVLLAVSFSRTAKQAQYFASQSIKRLEAKSKQLDACEIALAEKTKRLEASNAELEQFAHVASHDLQEPLRKISSYAKLLREECGEGFTDDAHRFVEIVIDGSNRMKQLVSDLLTFSRINTQGQALTATDANECLQEALDQLEFAIRDNEAQIHCEPLPMLLADADQLTTLLHSLIDNAIKFHASDCPDIHLGGHDRGDYFEVFVQDNGIGIHPDSFGRVFDIFQRLHNRQAYRGTGIGLAICKRIVERSGGSIWLESVPDQGTTVFFTLRKGSFANADLTSSQELDSENAALVPLEI